MWMGGYAARTKPSEGVALPLHAKALALEDGAGTRLVIVTTDLLGIARTMRDSLEAKVQSRYNLPPAGLLLNASHTHCGPELRIDRAHAAHLDERWITLAEQYVEGLEQQLLTLIGEALANLAPASLEYRHARCGFAMNRRLPVNGTFANRPNSEGPVDHEVPVLRVADAAAKPIAVMFGYACHNTTLNFQLFSGDYAGYAQAILEAENPGTMAMFLNGCSGDQNPYPRRSPEWAERHGRSLATAVEASLETVPVKLSDRLLTKCELVTLEFATPPTREELQLTAETAKEPARSHAQRLLEQLKTKGRITDTYSYPIQTVKFGDELLLVALAGEVVVDYSLRLKRELKMPHVWVAGYSNDVFGYVPSRRVLEEGGYEGGGAILHTSLPHSPRASKSESSRRCTSWFADIRAKHLEPMDSLHGGGSRLERFFRRNRLWHNTVARWPNDTLHFSERAINLAVVSDSLVEHPRIRPHHAGDFIGLPERQRLARIQAPDAIEEPLAAQHLVNAGNAACEPV